MVIGMATSKVTITLPDDQIKKIRALVRSGSVANTSAFVKHAVQLALDGVNGLEQMVDEILERTGGPATEEELAWARKMIAPANHRRPKRRKAA
jgi:Arc/MetJ-type ribon-helix-helix transcriptional regulator